MMKLIVRLLINAAALWVAAYFVSGIHITGGIVSLLLVALVFGVINAIIKPVVKFFSFPFIILTLGLFTLVINALMLLLTAGLTASLSIDGFAPAFFGGIVISVVSILLSLFVHDDKDD